MRAIVIYATCEGQTERIANRIAKTLKKAKVPTDTYDVTKQSAEELCLDAYQAVVFGSSVHYEYTDWKAVEEFANRFARFVHQCRQPKPQGPRFHLLNHPHREYSTAKSDAAEKFNRRSR